MNDVERLTELLADAAAILVFTGAGISTESGISDYRGPSGKWKTKEPVYFDDFMHRHEARIEYWDQKLETWPSIRDARPNAAHGAIVELERAGRLLLLATQNIDGLHEAAGTGVDRLVELHGSNRKVACMSCWTRTEPDRWFEEFAATREPPVCPDCGGWLKPATISFGQALDQDALVRSFAAAEQADLVMSLGSTLSVHPAASIPLAAARRGVPYVIVNLGVTEHDPLPGVHRFEGKVGELLPPAVDAALART